MERKCSIGNLTDSDLKKRAFDVSEEKHLLIYLHTARKMERKWAQVNTNSSAMQLVLGNSFFLSCVAFSRALAGFLPEQLYFTVQ